MQTFSTNIVRPTFRNRATGVRLGMRLAIACMVAGVFCNSVAIAQTPGQSSQLSGWDAPEFNPQAASPSNQVRTQIGLATLPEAPTAGTNTSVSLPPAPRPLLAPVHAPFQIPTQTHVQTATFETEDLNPETGTVPAANGFAESPITADSISAMFNSQASDATSPEGIWPSIKVGLLLAVLSLAPAIILMTTCYVRVVVVLTLLRQAFGGQQLPPMQVITALSLFLTMLIMAPVWNQVKSEAIDPYTRQQNPITWEEAWQRGIAPVKHFMVSQIKASGNTDSVAVFYEHLPDAGPPPSTIEQVPVNVLLPAFLISELKVAFLLGFQIFLPFLVLDLVVSSVTVSSGMMMLPPTMVSFPLKLILFVMVDGWNLVVGMLLQSFAPMQSFPPM